MALDKSIAVKRKVQKLARDGHVRQAIEQMRQLLTLEEVDPYDHVYLGDLLIREGELQEALVSWQEAVRSYERVGLYRNAIAIGRKILRLDPGRRPVHRTLGDLFFREGLTREAVPHYLAYLDSADTAVDLGDEFLDTLDRVGEIPGLAVEVALRLSDLYLRVQREDRAAVLLYNLADQAEGGGSRAMADDLRERARSAEAGFLARQSSEGEIGATYEAAASVRAVDPAPDRTEDPVAVDPREAEAIAAQPALLNLEADLIEELASLTGAAAAPDAAEVSRPESVEAETTEDPPLEVLEFAGVPSQCMDGPEDPAAAEERECPIEADESTAEAASAPTPAEPEVILSALEPDPEADPEAFEILGSPSTEAEEPEPLPEEAAFSGELETSALPRGAPQERSAPDGAFQVEHFPVSGNDRDVDAGVPAAGEPDLGSCDISRTRRAQLEQAGSALRQGDLLLSRRLYEHLLQDNPVDREVLEGLVQVTDQAADPAGTVYYLTRLGDAWIDEEEFAEALALFLRVLHIDSENAVARRRLTRFREMGIPGSEWVPEESQSAIQGVLDSGGARVVTAGQPTVQSDEWVDLGELLEAFQTEVKKQIDGDDYQSHYDLAVSHRSMGLHEEAIAELDQVLSGTGLPETLEVQARELRGTSLMELERYREAVHEFREALERSPEAGQRRWTVLYHLGRALETVGEWREAVDSFEELVRDAPTFFDAAQRRDYCRAQIELNQATDRAA